MRPPMPALDPAAARAVAPRAASTTLVLRDGEQSTEVLMVKRSLQLKQTRQNIVWCICCLITGKY